MENQGNVKARKVANWYVLANNGELYECKKKADAVKIIETHGLKKLIHGFEFQPVTQTITKVTF